MQGFKQYGLLLSVCLLFTLSFSAQTLAAKSKIGIIVFDGVLTSDVTAPIEVFGAATKKAWFSSYEVVVVAATRKTTITTEEGLTLIADHTIYDDLKLDVLIVASAYDMTPHTGNKDLIAYIKRHSQRQIWMASNCSGASLLGEAGVLDGKRATTWAGGEKALAKRFPRADIQFDRNVVMDTKLVTSNGGPVSYQAAFILLAQLSSQEFSDEIAQLIQFNRLATAF